MDSNILIEVGEKNANGGIRSSIKDDLNIPNDDDDVEDEIDDHIDFP